jgi:2-polyprenyl-3-methyl-5-hydroxy-6-metoxy-1,4-benzoquinol methylase
MDVLKHWDLIYGTKAPETVSWFRPHLETSLGLIERLAPNRSAEIIDVGGGESTLVDDLLARGFQNLTVLDVSGTALEATRERLGPTGHGVCWLVANMTQARMTPDSYDVWHDRAAFHFLTEPGQRTAYVERAASAVKPGGHILISTFGLEGPPRCSGLDVVRYDAETLQREFGASFRLVDSLTELHHTPSGSCQQFTYCTLQKT